MPALSPTLALACELIRRPSVTPDDAGCQALMMQRLTALGFHCEPMRIGEVDNFWAVRGEGGPLLCFAGHTDVVPTGDKGHWTYPPFAAHIDGNGLLYGRGAADMKGSLAAMLVATERFVREHPKHKGQIAFLITSDEEGPAINGTRAVVERLRERGQRIDWCIVGEPSSGGKLGDVVKNGRRGSLSCQIRVLGKQGHVAYPHLAKNPIHLAAPLLAELAATEWDAGNAFFPPTSFQVSNIHAGTGAGNVIPGELLIQCNFRFSTESSADSLKQRLEGMVQRHHLDCELQWTLFGEPFFTAPSTLLGAVCASVEQHCGFRPRAETTGGTSDGRFIAPLGAQVVELGPLNATIHQIDEHIAAADLDRLTDIYQSCLERLLLENP